VNHATETIATLDPSLAPRRRQRACRVGRHESQRSMGPMAIVMRHEIIEDPIKMFVEVADLQLRPSIGILRE
jgi:hypothetical protein